MQIRCTIEDNGDIQLSCICLKPGGWLDYLAFKEEAHKAFESENVKAYARYLREGLFCLFGHIEAIVMRFATD